MVEEGIKYNVKKTIRDIIHADIYFHSIRLISEFPGDGVKLISNILSHFANMKFSDRSIYNRIFQLVIDKGGESAMNYIKIFQNAQALSVSVGNSYTKDHLMHIFLDNFHQCGKCTAHIASHNEELKREEIFTDQKYSSLSSLQNDYLNLECSSDRNNEIANIVPLKCTFCVGSHPTGDKKTR